MVQKLIGWANGRNLLRTERRIKKREKEGLLMFLCVRGNDKDNEIKET